MPLHVSSTCAHHEEVKIALHSLWYHLTYRWPSHAQVERDDDDVMIPEAVYRLTESSLNLCTRRPPIGVMIPEAV